MITPAITRVTGLHFDNGDQIGLTITKTSGNYVLNKLMTYNGTTFESPDLLWYNNLNEPSTLTAYYPYAASGAPTEFVVAADQTGGYASSDLLGAVKTGVVPGSAPVAMLFRHLMTQLTVRITNTSTATVTGVTLGGFATLATVNFTDLTAAAKSGAAKVDIKTFEAQAGTSYQAVLVPQTGDLVVTVMANDGKTRSKTISGATLAVGKRYDLAVEVTDIDIRLTLSGEISDWEEGGTIGGNDGDGKLSYEGEQYKTKSIGGRLWMAENLRYKPAGVVLEFGMWYPEAGVVSVATQGMLYTRAIALAGATVTPGVPVRGICPPGWHIPDATELETLIGAGLGTDFFCCAGFRVVNADDSRYGAANKGYMMSASVVSGDDTSPCLSFTSPLGTLNVVPLSAAYGLTLRCVKDTK